MPPGVRLRAGGEKFKVVCGWRCRPARVHALRPAVRCGRPRLHDSADSHSTK
jgi:hypothetical protein